MPAVNGKDARTFNRRVHDVTDMFPLPVTCNSTNLCLSDFAGAAAGHQRGFRQMQVAIASLKEQVGALGVPEWRALRECRRGLGALLATIEGRTQS